MRGVILRRKTGTVSVEIFTFHVHLAFERHTGTECMTSNRGQNFHLVVSSPQLVISSCQLAVSSRQLVVSSRQLVISSCQLVVSSRQLFISSGQLVVSSRQLVISSFQLVVSSRQLVVLSCRQPRSQGLSSMPSLVVGREERPWERGCRVVLSTRRVNSSSPRLNLSSCRVVFSTRRLN